MYINKRMLDRIELLTLATNMSPRIRVILDIIMMPLSPYCTVGKFRSQNPIGVRVIDTITAP